MTWVLSEEGDEEAHGAKVWTCEAVVGLSICTTGARSGEQCHNGAIKVTRIGVIKVVDDQVVRELVEAESPAGESIAGDSGSPMVRPHSGGALLHGMSSTYEGDDSKKVDCPFEWPNEPRRCSSLIRFTAIRTIVEYLDVSVVVQP